MRGRFVICILYVEALHCFKFCSSDRYIASFSLQCLPAFGSVYSVHSYNAHLCVEDLLFVYCMLCIINCIFNIVKFVTHRILLLTSLVLGHQNAEISGPFDVQIYEAWHLFH